MNPAERDGSIPVADAVRLRALEERVRRLETAARSLGSAFVAVLLVGGSVLPWYREDGEAYSLVSMLGGFGGDERSEVEWVMWVGFLGLVVCTGIALVVLWLRRARELRPGEERTGQVVAVLLMIGACVPVLLSAAWWAQGESAEVEPRAAMLLYAPGVVLFALLALGPAVRRRAGEAEGSGSLS